MLGSATVYVGFVIILAGLVRLIMLPRHLGVPKPLHAWVVAALGAAVVAIGLSLPAPESRITRAATRLDQFMPAWQFNEFHTIRIAAPPAQAYQALKAVRANEIFLFRTLGWIRRGGRPMPQSLLDPGNRESVISVALKSGFVQLADDAPRELLLGTVVVAPPGTRGTLTPEVFKKKLSPGFALAAMNFLVEPDPRGGSLVSTETRVYANSSEARRRFARYWRVIYPGSALIRRMWLRAVEKRAVARSP